MQLWFWIWMILCAVMGLLVAAFVWYGIIPGINTNDLRVLLVCTHMDATSPLINAQEKGITQHTPWAQDRLLVLSDTTANRQRVDIPWSGQIHYHTSLISPPPSQTSHFEREVFVQLHTLVESLLPTQPNTGETRPRYTHVLFLGSSTWPTAPISLNDMFLHQRPRLMNAMPSSSEVELYTSLNMWYSPLPIGIAPLARWKDILSVEEWLWRVMSLDHAVFRPDLQRLILLHERFPESNQHQCRDVKNQPGFFATIQSDSRSTLLATCLNVE